MTIRFIASIVLLALINGASANTGSELGYGSNKAVACDQAINAAKRAAEDYQYRNPPEGGYSVIKTDKKKTDITVSECSCSRDEKSDLHTCQAKWSVK